MKSKYGDDSEDAGEWLESKPQLGPALAHAHVRDPGRPVFGKKAEHRGRLDAACIMALDRDLSSEALAKAEDDAPDRPADATLRI
jgi:hypothetical protein